MSAPDEIRSVELDTPEVAAARAKARRGRSIGLAIALAGFSVIFYVLTIVKMGPGLFDRAL